MTTKRNIPQTQPSAWFNDLKEEQFAHILQKRTQALAQPPEIAVQGTTMDMLTFIMGQEIYGIDTRYVREIQLIHQITPVPRTPRFVLGITSVRGQLISVINLKAFLGLSKQAPADESKLIIVANEALELGLLVDDVREVLKLFLHALDAPLALQNKGLSNFVLGLSQGKVVVLDMNSLLNSQDLIIS